MASSDPMKWVWRAVTGFTLVFGWIFILWHNKFHIDPPVVVVMLAFLAVVLAIANLWRVGATAVMVEDSDPDSWGRPLGERGELEREKRTLLKAIKEAEFDQAMGKLSPRDAEELIQMYRGRAIEVIKELDRLDSAGANETPRQKIERELAARLALEEQKGKARSKAKGKAAKAASAKAAKTEPAKAAKTEPAKTEPAKAAKTEPAKAANDPADDADSDAADDADDAPNDPADDDGAAESAPPDELAPTGNSKSRAAEEAS